jgi:hypothetical protein
MSFSMVSQTKTLHVMSHFCREVEENCALLGYYAARSGNCSPTFRDYLSVPFLKAKVKDGADRFSRNVGKELPLLTA